MNFILAIAKFILNIYLVLYALIHLLVYIYPETVRFLIFQNFGKKKLNFGIFPKLLFKFISYI